MCCCLCLEILNNFLFEPVFCKWSLLEHWSMCESRGDTHNVLLLLATLFAYGIQDAAISIKFHWIHDVWEFNEAQSEDKISRLHLGLSKLGRWQPLEATLSVWTRTWLPIQKEGNGIWRNTDEQDTLSDPFLLIFLSISQQVVLKVI